MLFGWKMIVIHGKKFYLNQFFIVALKYLNIKQTPINQPEIASIGMRKSNLVLSNRKAKQNKPIMNIAHIIVNFVPKYQSANFFINFAEVQSQKKLFLNQIKV